MARGSDPTLPVFIVRFSALGDVAMTLPVVYEACACHPGRRFVYITRKHPAQLFVNSPSNLIVEAVDTSAFPGIAGMRNLCDMLIARHGKPGMLIDLHDVLRTKLMRFFLRLRGVRTVHVDKGRLGRHRLTRSHHKVLLPLPPMRSRYRETFARAGFPATHSFKSLYYPEKADPKIFHDVAAPKKPGETWIAIAPFAKHPGKIYPPELMEKVVSQLAERPGYKVFLFGMGAEEEELLESWCDIYGNVCVNMARKQIGMGREAALLSHCDVMVSMDSANMHLASLVGLRVISIWGATHPYCGFMGYNQDAADCVQLDMTCRPCSIFGDKPCRRGDFHCLAGISPDRILALIDRSR